MNPKIIAHRGASAQAPENTMAAFQLALDQHADGIELDVMLSRDNRVIVIHDATVDRTTNGTGKVKDLTWAELQKLDAGNGQKIPTLEEVFDAFGSQLLINIELKNFGSIFDSLPIAVANLVKDFQLEKSVIISSFNLFNLPRFRRQGTESHLGVLTLPGKADHWLYRLFRYDALHPHFNDVTQTMVEKIHTKGKQINVWTVDAPDEIRRLASLQVDSIITNDPLVARSVLEQLL